MERTNGSTGAIAADLKQNPVNGKARHGLEYAAGLIWAWGNVQLLRELAAMFLREYPSMLAEVRDSIAQSDCGKLTRSAHTLKGRAGFFSIDRVYGAAWELETMGRTHDLARATQVLTEIEAAMGTAMVELAFLAVEK